MRPWGLVLVGALLLTASPARAQENGSTRSVLTHFSKGVRSARNGDWVTYRFDGGGMRVYYWRMAVVGEEKDKQGRDAVWVEMEAGTHPAMKSPLMQIRMLVAREGDQIRYDAISRLYVGGPFDRPQEFSDEALEHVLKQMNQEALDDAKENAAEAAKAPPLPAGMKPVVRSGKETRLMTLAGTVTAVQVELVVKRTVIKRMWLSREIPLLQMAKVEIPGIAHSMEVAEYGIDAKPRMLMPAPNAPKVRLEYADRVFPDLPIGEPAEESEAPEKQP